MIISMQTCLNITAIIFVVVACLYVGLYARRHLGGAYNPIRWVARLQCHLAAFTVSFVTVGANPWIVGIFTLVIGGVFWFQQGHGDAHGMNFADTPTDKNYRTGISIVIFLGNYCVAMMFTGIMWSLISGEKAGLYYALFGLLVWVPHWAVQQSWFPWGWWIFKDYEGTHEHLIDCRTSAGECGLGAIVIGTPPIALLIDLLTR